MNGWRVGRAEVLLDERWRREWLVTNGRGGYASGTVAGILTRRYHGLLIAALAPPVQRRLVVAKCELDVTYDGSTYELSANCWSDGTISPAGYRLCQSFAMVDGTPTWTYACSDALIEQSIAMAHDRDTMALCLTVVRARCALSVRARILAADRDHHGGVLPEPQCFVVDCSDSKATIRLPECSRTLTVRAARAIFAAASERYRGFALPREAERGLTAVDDYAHVATFCQVLDPGASGGCVLSLEDDPESDPAALIGAARKRYRGHVAASAAAVDTVLAAAADAFVVRRGSGPHSGTTIVAGYHWFADWGRDTMIALPGLTLHTGRPAIAREILLTFARSIDGGMLPNRFPDDGSAPEYNTVDAALWFIEAVRAYVTATGDRGFLAEIFDALASIVDGYVAGTRYGIRVDDADGLVRAGVPGMQLTWMDAKVGSTVITPRIGKPIEISALWYAALRAMEQFAVQLGLNVQPYRSLAEHCATGMQRYWNAERGYCFDLLDGPDGNDPALRPNQLFAVSQHAVAFDAIRARGIVDSCTRELLTSYGLRTLGPRESAYRGRYGGDQTERDRAYHQGTVWPWLMGPFVRAHLRVYADVATATTFVTPMLDALCAYGIGSLAEIFEGDAPHAPCGAIAQAWSIAELIAARSAIAVVQRDA